MNKPLCYIFLLLGLVNGGLCIADMMNNIDLFDSLLQGFTNIFNDVNTTDVKTSYVLGKWHQMYRAAVNFDVFRTQMYCHVSYWKPNLVMGPDGFSIEEAYHVISNSGPIEEYLKDVTKTGPGQYWVYPHQYFYPHQFYIMKTGPVVNDSYQYLIATDSNKLALQVLARDPANYMAKYDKEVRDYMANEKFGDSVFWNQPVAIYQGPDCYYPTQKEIFARRVLKEQYNKKTKTGSPFGGGGAKGSGLDIIGGLFGGFGG